MRDTTSSDPPPPYSASSDEHNEASLPAQDAPSLDDQVQRVLELVSTSLVAGEKGYLVSSTWVDKIFARASQTATSRDYSKEALEGEIGPVDNTDIVPPTAFQEPHLRFRDTDVAFIPIKPQLSRVEDFEIVPEQAWEEMMQWHGLTRGQHPIVLSLIHISEPTRPY